MLRFESWVSRPTMADTLTWVCPLSYSHAFDDHLQADESSQPLSEAYVCLLSTRLIPSPASHKSPHVFKKLCKCLLLHHLQASLTQAPLILPPRLRTRKQSASILSSSSSYHQSVTVPCRVLRFWPLLSLSLHTPSALDPAPRSELMLAIVC